VWGLACAVVIEGGRPWTLFQHGRAALPIICGRVVFMLITTCLPAGAIGVIARIGAMPLRACRTAALVVSISFALLGYIFLCFAPPDPGSLTIWFPSVLFGPRIAQRSPHQI